MRGPMTHVLKSDSDPFKWVYRRLKTAEFRKLDRDYKIGDTLEMWEQVEKNGYTIFTGNKVTVAIMHIATGYGIPEGYGMLSFNYISDCIVIHDFERLNY